MPLSVAAHRPSEGSGHCQRRIATRRGSERAPALALENITVTFVARDAKDTRYTAVRDATLVVEPGEFVSVVGPTGCGKSTLLNVAVGLLEPSAGTVKASGDRAAVKTSSNGFSSSTSRTLAFCGGWGAALAGSFGFIAPKLFFAADQGKLKALAVLVLDAFGCHARPNTVCFQSHL